MIGREEAAADLAAQAETMLGAVTGRVAGVPEERRPRVYYARGPRGLETALGGSINVEALEVMGEGRLEWDAAETEIGHAFMTIRQVVTGSGQITYAAGRTASTGHADVAWAIMHGLAAEPLARQTGVGGCTVAIGA